MGIEQLLMKSEFVQDCYIAEHPTQRRLAAWVELSAKGTALFREQGRKTVIEKLKEWLSIRQEKTAIPRFWRFTDKLPRNNQSKISRSDFEQIFIQLQIDPVWLTQEKQNNLYILQGKVPFELCYFKGHFARFPLVPGVVELQWVKEKIDTYFGKDMQIARIDNLKFQKFLRPNDKFELTLKWEESKSRIGFQLKTEDEMCASGLVIFKNG